MTPRARSSQTGPDVRTLMPGSSPPPVLRPPGAALHGRYMSNQLEHEYAALADQLDALEHDIRHARKVSRVAQRPPARTRAASPEPHGEPVVLPDGARVLVRPIEPADGPQLRAGFDRLDAGSRYQRFLAPIDYLSQRQLDYLTRIDHESHEALVALDAATGDGVGIARFVRDASDPTRADVAIVIADRWHGRGVGTLLANRLAARARAVGVTSFTARMLAGNRAGRRLVERVGQEIRQREDGGAIVLTAQTREHTQPVAEPPARAARRHTSLLLRLRGPLRILRRGSPRRPSRFLPIPPDGPGRILAVTPPKQES